MKKVKRRTLSLIVLVAVLVIGLAVFMFRLVKDGSSWVSFPANRAVFTDGVLTSGRLTDRNGVVLADITDGYRTYAESSEVRKACLHVVGDTSGNIGTGALTAFASKLVGYDLISGTYSLTGKGKTVALSIDSSLNTVAYEALNGRKGTVAVCNYETGEILCNVSNPTYDPANPPESVDSSEYEGVYINRFLSSQYTPGSIFKIVTLTAAIENIDDLFDRTFTCNGSFDVGGDTVTCTGYHGDIKIEEALAVSCNCVFGQLALELGADTLEEYAGIYGLTETINVDGITTAKGNFDKADGGTANLAWSGIGQYNDTVSPIGMLHMMCAIAGGGDAVELTMFKRTGIKLFTSAKTEHIISASTANEIDSMMAYNVTYNYGESNYPGLGLHAKSGTAEVGGGMSPHAWFVGYIDNENYPLAFVVMVENGGGGSSTAGAIANTVLQAAVNG